MTCRRCAAIRLTFVDATPNANLRSDCRAVAVRAAAAVRELEDPRTGRPGTGESTESIHQRRVERRRRHRAVERVEVVLDMITPHRPTVTARGGYMTGAG